MTTTVVNTKISEVENKIPDHSKYYYYSWIFWVNGKKIKKKERLNQANLVCKPDFDNKLISFNR